MQRSLRAPSQSGKIRVFTVGRLAWSPFGRLALGASRLLLPLLLLPCSFAITLASGRFSLSCDDVLLPIGVVMPRPAMNECSVGELIPLP